MHVLARDSVDATINGALSRSLLGIALGCGPPVYLGMGSHRLACCGLASGQPWQPWATASQRRAVRPAKWALPAPLNPSRSRGRLM